MLRRCLPARHTSRFTALSSLLAFLVLILLGGPSPAFAQSDDARSDDARTDDTRLTTVAAVLDEPYDDRTVALRGEILEQLSSDKYTFSDETGQIRIEIDDDIPNVTITVGLRLRIVGEIETAFMRQPEIDVEDLTVLPDAS